MFDFDCILFLRHFLDGTIFAFVFPRNNLYFIADLERVINVTPSDSLRHIVCRQRRDGVRFRLDVTLVLECQGS